MIEPEHGGKPRRCIKMNLNILKKWIQSCQTPKGTELRKNALEFAASSARHDAKQSAKRRASVLETDEEHRANKEAKQESNTTGEVAIPPFIMAAKPYILCLWQMGNTTQAMSIFLAEQKLHDDLLLLEKKRSIDSSLIDKNREAADLQRAHEAKMATDNAEAAQKAIKDKAEADQKTIKDKADAIKYKVEADQKAIKDKAEADAKATKDKAEADAKATKDREASELKLIADHEASEFKIAKEKEERELRVAAATIAAANKQREHETAMAKSKEDAEEKQRAHELKTAALRLKAEQTASVTATRCVDRDAMKGKREDLKERKESALQTVANILSDLLKAYGHNCPPSELIGLATVAIREAKAKGKSVESVVEAIEESSLRKRLFPVDTVRFVNKTTIGNKGKTAFFDVMRRRHNVVSFYALKVTLSKLVVTEVFDSLLASTFSCAYDKYLANRTVVLRGTTIRDPAINTWNLWPLHHTDTLEKVAEMLTPLCGQGSRNDAARIMSTDVPELHYDGLSPIQRMTNMTMMSLGVVGYDEPMTSSLFKGVDPSSLTV